MFTLQALETVLEERERLREAGDGGGSPEKRHEPQPRLPVTRRWTLCTRPPKHVRAALEHMKVVEEMRRTLRDIRDVHKLDSN